MLAAGRRPLAAGILVVGTDVVAVLSFVAPHLRRCFSACWARVTLRCIVGCTKQRLVVP